ncbi:MAG: 16S rRNA (cytosine(1402)-N(4))-methyltransferase RsmH [Planctomycetales bacterium]|nr:16S rRNA (cytosine(1402)-N(4))-methyltransferase RsmH [Planctomycetales bacterium]
MVPATVHVPVLPKEILEICKPQPGTDWIDGTAGGGGHANLIAEQLKPMGRLLALDRDPVAVKLLASVLPDNCLIKNDSYDRIPQILLEVGWQGTDGILLDLGLSSDQLADRSRGFSFQESDAILDMRFDMSTGETVAEWLQYADEKEIADVIYHFGEERFSRRIAKRIVYERKASPIKKVADLRELIYRSVPGGRRKQGRIDPATRTFQALRIFINDELAILRRALEVLPNCLQPGGYLAIISFHSLEDRMVKYAFRSSPILEVVTRKPVQASDIEVASNNRARSAKLRVARRLSN